MAKERRKVIVAGRLWMAVQYTSIHSQNQQVRREARAMISDPAREAMNAKMSWQKLMLVLAANFKADDLVVTLTYRDEQLPRFREDAHKRLSYFVRLLRAERRGRGQPLVGVKITEGYHTGGRLHHHFIVNSTGEDFDEIRKLWGRYGDDVDFEQFGADGAERWAKYLTKEPRIQGRRHVGDRTWTTTRNVKKPVVLPIEYVSEGENLLPPPGAIITDKTECQNSYGRFCHMMAILPEQTTEKQNSDLG